mmetsp:Transcript_58191/g.104510  ORF Transcript_58191/g.104510 Transcript_58191/m.104510 type:complete len:204 (+) Transcript_58191:523-1134(+)
MKQPSPKIRRQAQRSTPCHQLRLWMLRDKPMPASSFPVCLTASPLTVAHGEACSQEGRSSEWPSPGRFCANPGACYLMRPLPRWTARVRRKCRLPWTMSSRRASSSHRAPLHARPWSLPTDCPLWQRQTASSCLRGVLSSSRARMTNSCCLLTGSTRHWHRRKEAQHTEARRSLIACEYADMQNPGCKIAFHRAGNFSPLALS